MRKTDEMLSRLPEIADEALKDITATAGLKNRILAAAENGQPARAFFTAGRLVPVLACALVLALGLGTVLPRVLGNAGQTDAHRENVAAVQLLSAIASGQLPEGSAQTGLDLPGGSFSVTGQSGNKMSNWAEADEKGMPVITVNGGYYRLLMRPASASASLKGACLGTVGAECESAHCAPGEQVYAVSGMDRACVMARVGGEWRLFQRVSYAGRGPVGNESLTDTLLCAAVSSIAVSGSGEVTGSEAQRLANILASSAVYQGNNISERGSVMTVTFKNGVQLQMTVSNGRLNACGSWACPEFFDEFDRLAN